MALPDRHDPRQFDHYVKLDDKGRVVSTVEVAAGSEPGSDAVYVKITDCYPYDFDGAHVKVTENVPIDVPPIIVFPTTLDSPTLWKGGKSDPEKAREGKPRQGPPQPRIRPHAELHDDLAALNTVPRA